MASNCAWLAVLAMACTSASPSASAAPGSNSSPMPATAAGAHPAPSNNAPAQPQRGDLADVAPAPGKTATGGEVFAVGQPRFQVADPEGSGPVTLRVRHGAVFAEDAKFISIWDAANGASLRRIAPRLDAAPAIFVSLAVSADGEWLATGSSHAVRVFQAPFDKPVGELACSTAYAFSHSGSMLACSTNVLGVWALAKRKLVAPLPANAPKGLVRAVRFAPDDRSLVWTTDQAIMKWDFVGTGAVSVIYQPPARIDYAAISDGGSAVYVSLAAKHAVVVDLATGKTWNAPADYGVAISPSGRRIARATAGIEVMDVTTGKLVWNAKVASPVTRLAFGETDDAVAYIEAGRVRVATFPGDPSAPARTARLAGWLAAGVAAIERGDALRSFTLATRASAVADRAALASKPLDHAPAWARWVTDAGSDGAIAAEPSKRHGLAADRRGDEACTPMLRVWTSSGGAKALTMTCTKAEIEGHEDPGWEIGGGWAVGVSATKATIYDPRTGRRIGAIDVPARKVGKPEFAPAFWQMALAPTGDWLALVWRRAVLEGSNGTSPADPREDAMHIADTAASVDCVSGEHGCQLEYFVELWNIKGVPKRVWQTRLERLLPGRQLAEPATPTGVLDFDASGSQLLLGFDDGEIRVVPTAKPEAARSEHLHVAAIRRLSMDPSGAWAFSEDAAGEQRIWKLAR